MADNITAEEYRAEISMLNHEIYELQKKLDQKEMEKIEDSAINPYDPFIADIGEPHRLARRNHGLDARLVVLINPVGPEDARHAGRGENEGVGLEDVAFVFVVVSVSVVIIDKSDGVGVSGVVVNEARRPPGGAVLLP